MNRERDLTVQGGDGWAALDAAHYSGKPGVHDLGKLLGATTTTLLLVILRPAERWAADDDIETNGWR